jgi:hypothetical protein
MSNSNKSKAPAQPGDTVIAYIDNNTACVGIVVQNSDDATASKDYLSILLLGYFEDRSIKQDVFHCQESFPFPSYKRMEKSRILPYNFLQEINLCKEQNSGWWEKSEPPCRTNLISWHFQPRHATELQFVAIAIHILNGGIFDNFDSFKYLGMECFLKLWAVLSTHFPDRVTPPPQELNERNSNAYYVIDLLTTPAPHVVCKYRSTT